jgi:hypothetical protein
MDRTRELGDSEKLGSIELAYVVSIVYDGSQESAAGKMVEYHAVFSGIHPGAAQKGLIFFDQLLFIGESLENFQSIFIDGGSGIVVYKTLGHPDGEIRDPIGSQG